VILSENNREFIKAHDGWCGDRSGMVSSTVSGWCTGKYFMEAADGAIEAKTFSGLCDCGRPNSLSRNRRRTGSGPLTAAGVTPLEYTVLSGGHPRAKARWCGNEGAGVIEDAATPGSRWEAA